MKKSLIIFAIIIAAIAVIVLVSRNSNDEFISEYVIDRETISNTVRAFGRSEPEVTYSLGFQIGGTLRSLPFEVGDKVKETQVVARLDSRDINANITRAQSLVSVERSRLNQLATPQSQEITDITKERIERQQQQIENADRTLSDATIAARNQLESIVSRATDQYFRNEDTMIDVRFTYSNIEISEQLRSLIIKTRIDLEEAMRASRASLGGEESYVSLSIAIDNTKRLFDLMAQPLSTEVIREINIYNDLEDAKDSLEAIRSGTSGPLNALEIAKSDLEILQKELASQGVGADSSTLSVQESVIGSRRADLSALYSDLSKYRLGSPIDGVVFQTFKEEFEPVRPQEFVISIVPDKPLVVRADIAEADIVFIGTGNKVAITFDALGERVYEAVVDFVEPQISQERSTPAYETTFTFLEGQDLGAIRSGMTANIIAQSGTVNDVIAVPETYIYQNDYGPFVYLVSNAQQTANHPITVGVSTNDGMIQVLSGLSVGDSIARVKQKR